MSRLPSDPPLELGSEHRLDRLHVTLLVSVSMSKSSLSSSPTRFQLSPLRMLRKMEKSNCEEKRFSLVLDCLIDLVMIALSHRFCLGRGRPHPRARLGTERLVKVCKIGRCAHTEGSIRTPQEIAGTRLQSWGRA